LGQQGTGGGRQPRDGAGRPLAGQGGAAMHQLCAAVRAVGLVLSHWNHVLTEWHGDC